MGFWHRLLGTGTDRRIDARAVGTALPRRWRTPEPTQLSCDPREAAQALLLALDNAADFGFHPTREITVDDIDFDFYNGPRGFCLEQLSALLRLSDDDGTPLFPRALVFDPVGELSYLKGGEAVHIDIAVEGDWADPDVVHQLFEDATPEGHRWVSTGDYGVHVWVPEQHATEVARIFSTEDTAAEARIAGRLHEER